MNEVNNGVIILAATNRPEAWKTAAGLRRSL